VVFEPNQLLKNQKSYVQFFKIFSFSALLKSHDLSLKPFDIIAINIFSSIQFFATILFSTVIRTYAAKKETVEKKPVL
jgi:hypothetical protein